MQSALETYRPFRYTLPSIRGTKGLPKSLLAKRRSLLAGALRGSGNSQRTQELEELLYNGPHRNWQGGRSLNLARNSTLKEEIATGLIERL